MKLDWYIAPPTYFVVGAPCLCAKSVFVPSHIYNLHPFAVWIIENPPICPFQNDCFWSTKRHPAMGGGGGDVDLCQRGQRLSTFREAWGHPMGTAVRIAGKKCTGLTYERVAMCMHGDCFFYMCLRRSRHVSTIISVFIRFFKRTLQSDSNVSILSGNSTWIH